MAHEEGRYLLNDPDVLRRALDDLGDQLRRTIDGDFDTKVRCSVADETLDKLSMLINSVLESARRGLAELARRNAALADLDALRTSFVANVSHELRTPLTLLLSHLGRARAGGLLGEADVRHLDVALVNARVLLKHVDDLLDLAKIDAGKMHARRRLVDASALVESLARQFRCLAGDRGVAFDFEVPEGIPLAIDEEMFRKILLNLLSNAFKFAPRGGHVRLTFGAPPEAGRSPAVPGGTEGVAGPLGVAEPVGVAGAVGAWLVIEDDGPGIEPECRSAIFGRFEQALPRPGPDGESDSPARAEGTGLGLAIVHDYVQLNGGDVSVDDSPLGGALFRVTFPSPEATSSPDANGIERVGASAALEAVAMGPSVSNQLEVELDRVASRPFSDGEAPPASAGVADVVASDATARPDGSEIESWRAAARAPTGGARAPSTTCADGDPVRVLVVEDTPALARMLMEILQGDGFEVTVARDGHEGLDRAAASSPDVILSDVMMPRLSGPDMFDALRASPALSPIPVIFLTARADDGTRLALLRKGAYDFLAKPFGEEELIARVRNAGNFSRARRVLATALDSRQSDVVALSRALAERKRDLEAAARLKDEFLATVSHELRTPLTPMLGWLDLMQARLGDPRMLETAVTSISRNTRSLARIVDDLLDVSRQASGKLVLDPRPDDLGAVVASAAETFSVAAKSKRVELLVSTPSRPCMAFIDPDRIRQVVANLLSNALKFTPPGGRVSLAVRRATAGAFEVEVEDTGSGIGPTFLPHVFERFLQEDGSKARKFGGLGLGLSLARHLVELHGGVIAAHSDGEGRGARFVVRLPATMPATMLAGIVAGPASSLDGREGDPEGGLSGTHAERHVSAIASGSLREGAVVRNGAVARERAVAREGSLAGLAILVVEDTEDVATLLTVVLERQGAEVTRADSARAALRALASGGYDLLVSDISMPDESGHDLIRRVREFAGRSSAIPAIALSGFTRREDAQQSLDAGFQLHMGKPVDPDALVAAARRLARPEAPAAEVEPVGNQRAQNW